MGEGHIDITGVTQESPLLETSLIAPIDSLVEGVDHSLEGRSVDEVPSAMTEFLDDGCQGLNLTGPPTHHRIFL